MANKRIVILLLMTMGDNNNIFAFVYGVDKVRRKIREF